MLIYDAHSLFDTVLDNAPAYGFKNNNCLNSTDCFWWNNYHPETAFHQKLAHDMTTNLTELGWCTGGGCL
jgi:phospholipase/lecithinase/hemolysin